jgi:hypothetical protein
MKKLLKDIAVGLVIGLTVLMVEVLLHVAGLL